MLLNILLQLYSVLQEQQIMYNHVFRDMKKIYYLDFFQNRLNDKTLNLKVRFTLSGSSYAESGEHIVHTLPQNMEYAKQIFKEGVLWFSRLKESIHELWDENSSTKMPEIFEYLLSRKIESIECRETYVNPPITEIIFDKNKVFLSCVEDHFQYQWKHYQKLFDNSERKTTEYAWIGLPAISYIIIQNQDDSFCESNHRLVTLL